MAETTDEAIVDAFLHLRDCLGACPSFRDLGRAFGVHHDTAGQLVKAALSAPDQPPHRRGRGAQPPLVHGSAPAAPNHHERERRCAVKRAKCTYCGRIKPVTRAGKIRKHYVTGGPTTTAAGQRVVCGGSGRTV